MTVCAAQAYLVLVIGATLLQFGTGAGIMYTCIIPLFVCATEESLVLF